MGVADQDRRVNKHFSVVPHLNGSIVAAASDQMAVSTVTATSGRCSQPTLRSTLHDAFMSRLHVFQTPNSIRSA